MSKSDDNNLVLVQCVDSVDELNAQFYGKYPYPWRPIKFDYLLDADFQTVMLNQTIGDWKHQVIPKRPAIWVAGCGTNQAVFAALNFPKATVLGSDLSSESLELSASTAREMGISNLVHRKESINHATYKDQFDYIICTGVIHHNADPEATLRKLAAALKPTGILELMVYSRYERLPTTAFQKAIRLFGGNSGSRHFDLDLSNAKKLINQVKLKNFSILNQSHIDDYPESMLADVLIQPVENSYTVESLEDLGAACNLELVSPCVSTFDRTLDTFLWNMEFTDPELQSHYNSMPDSRRWQITNHLMFENSPLLWFYLQRKDRGGERKSEGQICEEFLDAKFVKSKTTQRNYLREDESSYRLSPHSVPFPPPSSDALVRIIVETVASMGRQSSMRDVFQRLEIETTFQTVNKLRINLTTLAFPYLKAIETLETEADRRQRVTAERRLEENSLSKLKAVKRRPIST